MCIRDRGNTDDAGEMLAAFGFEGDTLSELVDNAVAVSYTHLANWCFFVIAKCVTRRRSSSTIAFRLASVIW